MLEPKPPPPPPKVTPPKPVPPALEPNVPRRAFESTGTQGKSLVLNVPVLEVLFPNAEPPPPKVLVFVLLLEPKENPVPPLPNDMVEGREARRAIFGKRGTEVVDGGEKGQIKKWW